jgi:hypothetical protein
MSNLFMRKIIICVLMLVSAVGCSSLPLRRIDYVALDSVDPKQLLEEYSGALPERSQVINSVVFQYKWQSFSALGYTDVRRDSGSFAVSCMNPVGIKLFELSGDKESIKTNFVLKELLKKGDLPRVVGEDIRRIYFDIIPSDRAALERKQYRFVFTAPYGEGLMKHVFAGSGHVLVEKGYYEKGRCLWRVFYGQYRREAGKLYPAGIMLKNYRYGYNLIIRLKEVR